LREGALDVVARLEAVQPAAGQRDGDAALARGVRSKTARWRIAKVRLDVGRDKVRAKK